MSYFSRNHAESYANELMNVLYLKLKLLSKKHENHSLRYFHRLPKNTIEMTNRWSVDVSTRLNCPYKTQVQPLTYQNTKSVTMTKKTPIQGNQWVAHLVEKAELGKKWKITWETRGFEKVFSYVEKFCGDSIPCGMDNTHQIIYMLIFSKNTIT